MTCAPSHTAALNCSLSCRGDARHDVGDPAIERADAGSEGVVDEVARERLLVLRQEEMALKGSSARCDRVTFTVASHFLRLVGLLVVRSISADSGDACCGQGSSRRQRSRHRTRPANTPRQTLISADGLVGPPLPDARLRFGSRQAGRKRQKLPGARPTKPRCLQQCRSGRLRILRWGAVAEPCGEIAGRTRQAPFRENFEGHGTHGTRRCALGKKDTVSFGQPVVCSTISGV